MQKLSMADGRIFGSPIYFAGVTGKMKSFFERFLFQYFVYDANYSSLAPKKMPTACIYTMNVTHAMMEELGYQHILRFNEFFIGKIFTPPHIIYVCNTYQFDDYSKYVMESFSEEEKSQYRREQFPIDCEKAFQLGATLIKDSIFFSRDM